MKTKPFLTGCLAGLLLTTVIGFFLLVNASTTPAFGLNNFAFTDLQGNPINLDSLSGKAVVVNIWATWCPPCIKEMPGIERAQAQLKNDPVVFLIASDEPIEKINRFKVKRNFNLPYYSFTLKETAIPMGEARPQTYIFNRDGKLVYNRMGAFEWDDEKILKRLESYIN